SIRHPDLPGKQMSRQLFGGATFLSHAAGWTGVIPKASSTFPVTSFVDWSILAQTTADCDMADMYHARNTRKAVIFFCERPSSGIPTCIWHDLLRTQDT
ncbi:MAG: hypothetical protein WCJ75_18050, partial [Desulfomonile sp.]